MGRGGKVGRKGNSRKRGWSNEASSDDSDEDYVVSDEEYSSSLDGLASEEEEEEEEEEECPRVSNYSRSKPKNGFFGWPRNASKTQRKRGRIACEDKEDEEGEEEEEEEEEDKDEDEKEVQEEQDDDEYKEEEKEEDDDDEYEEFLEEKDEDEENEGMRNFRRSKARNGVCGQLKNASKTSTKRRGITFSEPLEEDEEQKEEEDNMKGKEEQGDKSGKEDEDGKFKEEEEDKSEKEVDEDERDKEKEEYEEKEVEMEGDEGEEEETGDEWKEEEEGDADEEDEDFDFDDDDEFTPEEDDYSDEEEEMRGRGKNNNSMRKSKNVSQKRASVVSTRGQKRQSSKRPSRKKRRRNGRIRRTVKCDDGDDFIDNGPTVRTTSREKLGQKRRRVFLSDSDCMSSGSPEVEYTISEEEREQVREANELCGGSRINLRSSSLIKNEEDGVHEDLHLQRKPPGRKGKEKIEEPLGRKGKEKVEDLKSEVVKQVCGICLSEETKRRVRGVLNCCTHYFCFACIMEWAKVESRCPLCKQRFRTISKSVRSIGVDLREVVFEVPERDQVYQPSEEELRSYIDPYEHVICSECHQGGDDGLMLLCDICDSPAHTYCVGLGREVPEGNWYCDGCRPVALGSSGSEVQDRVAEQRMTIQSLPVRPPAIHVRESIDLNSMSSPRVGFTQGFGHLPTSRFTGRSVEGASPVSGGAPTLSERRWIHRQIHQLLSIDRMTSTTGRTNAIPVTSSISNLYNSPIDQSREIASEDATTQDVGTSYHTFFEETLNNTSPLNGALWPGLVGSTPVLDCEQIHQFNRSNNVIDDSLSSGVREESNNFHIAKEQLQSIVKNHLKSLSQNIDLGHNTIMEIARKSMHTILAACGLEHMKSEVCSVPPPAVCSHIELNAGGQMSLIKGCCSSCFDSFVGDVVKRILDSRFSSQWLRLGL